MNMVRHSYYAVFFTIVTVTGVLGNIRDSCAGLTTLGYTYPAGDITLEYGQPLNLTCILHDYIEEKDGKNASQDLYFYKNKESNQLPKEMVEILNSTSIRLYIEHPNKTTDDNYMCCYKNPSNLLCHNVVTIGVKPQNVTDFSCVSRNYENLTCTWTAPNNYVRTSYNLFYRIKSRSQRSQFRCPNITTDKTKKSCVWTISSEPFYRPAQPMYIFTLFMSNQFGNNSMTYTFDHFKYVIPNAPEELKVISKTTDSIQLSWKLPSSMKSFPPGVHHRILYQCEYYEKYWHDGGLITNYGRNESITFDLKNLKYAHALCDIRVSIKSAKADENDEAAWSENATITVRTESKIPDSPPEVNIGSFQILQKRNVRDIYIFWKQIKEEARNGKDFKYKVEIENTPITNYSEKSFVLLKSLPEEEFKINIWSVNDKGLSSKKSTLIIPRIQLPEPQHFIKIAHHSDLFELKWDHPNNLASKNIVIDKYTIFWCRSVVDRPYDCDGYLDWLTVPNNTLHYYLTLPKASTYQIAISANSFNSSSGMVWADCTIIPGKNSGKLKNVWIGQVGSNFINVEWKIDKCSDQITAPQGFVIYYCQIEKAQSECNGELKNVTIRDRNANGGTVSYLKPYKTYLLRVAVIISDNTLSDQSDPLRNTTREDAPSPPLNVRAVNVSENSITVNWDPPLEINGILRFYHIYLNDTKYQLEANEHNYTFNNLESFGIYKISLQACTSLCSTASKPLLLTTKMGVPGEIDKPVITAVNTSFLSIKWHTPKPPRGKTDFYQIRISYKKGLNNQTYDDVIKTELQNYNYTTSCDTKKHSTFYISVRAVNIIGLDEKYGPWSEALESSICSDHLASGQPFLIIIFVVILFIVVVAGVYFGFKKLYLYFEKMKDVQVKLPPGLQTVVEQPWVSGKLTDNTDRVPKPDPDEELLLEKFGDRFGVDAPAQDSTHESVTTPVDSGPHVSSELTKKTSLRQRNKTYSTADAPKPVQSTGNYCVFGVDPNKSLNSETKYLPGLENESPPPAYVTVDDMVKMPNPGYISFTPTEADEKNKGYVMAGMAKDLLVHDLMQCDPQKTFGDKTHYVRAADPLATQKGAQHPWAQSPLDATIVKSGYVSVGDAPPPSKSVGEVSKGYVPHRQFDVTKSIKED